jgi:hypothetical protein
MEPVRFTSDPVTGPVTFVLDATRTAVLADITIDPAATTAHAELSGPPKITECTRVSGSGRTWELTLPRHQSAGGIQVTGHGGTVFVTGDVAAGVSVVAGRVFVNGTEVTPGPAAGPARLTVTLPAGSAVVARLSAGSLGTHGLAERAEVSGISADLDIDQAGTVRASTVSGDITTGPVAGSCVLATTSGDVTADSAGGPVTVQTVSGDIRVHATAPVPVGAGSVSGDIRVTAAPGICPDVQARSVSGRVRTTGGAR